MLDFNIKLSFTFKTLSNLLSIKAKIIVLEQNENFLFYTTKKGFNSKCLKLQILAEDLPNKNVKEIKLE
jgi:hypothetical protein